MAWTSMHFAMGMACTGAGVATACYFLKRGWRWLPVAMTAGGAWALVPDSPRIFREDFPGLPFAATLGNKNIEAWLHTFGDLFFFHRTLDAQPHEYAVHGLALIVLMYNLALVLLMVMEQRQRNSFGNLAWRARKSHRTARRRLQHSHTSDRTLEADEDEDSPIVARFRSSHLGRSA